MKQMSWKRRSIVILVFELLGLVVAFVIAILAAVSALAS
jgi:hypothetical protein